MFINYIDRRQKRERVSGRVLVELPFLYKAIESKKKKKQIQFGTKTKHIYIYIYNSDEIIVKNKKYCETYKNLKNIMVAQGASCVHIYLIV